MFELSTVGCPLPVLGMAVCMLVRRAAVAKPKVVGSPPLVLG